MPPPAATARRRARRARRNPKVRRGQFAAEAVSRGGFEPAEPWVETYMAFRADAIPDALTVLTLQARALTERLQQAFAHDLAILGADDQAAFVDWFLTLPGIALLSRRKDPAAAMAKLEPGLEALRRRVSPVLRPILATPAVHAVLRKLWMSGLHVFDDDLTRLGTEFLAQAQDAIPAFAAHLEADPAAATAAFDGFRTALVDTLPALPKTPRAR
jgi:hypothetical protein